MEAIFVDVLGWTLSSYHSPSTILGAYRVTFWTDISFLLLLEVPTAGANRPGKEVIFFVTVLGHFFFSDHPILPYFFSISGHSA